MNNAPTPPSCPGPARPAELTFDRVVEVLWDSAWEALILAFLVQLFGSIAVGLVSGLWLEMAPSLPPFFAHQPLAEAGAGAGFKFTFLQQHRLVFLFAVLFVGKSAAQLLRHSGKEEHRQAVARLQGILGRVSGQWFKLVVVNAFTAFVAVMVLQLTQQFSGTQLLWQFVCDLCRPAFQAVVGLLPGAGTASLLENLAAWYGDNQFKFMFWLCYSAAICDDLGLPNYKTLARFLWRRFLKPRSNRKGAKAGSG